MAWLNRAPLMLALLLLPLAACTSTTSDVGEGISTPTVSPDDEATQLDGETTEVDGQVRLTVPDGWTVQTAEITGWGAHLATVVPEGTADDALAPNRPHAGFAHIVMMNIRQTNGAEGHVAAQIERDRANTEFYSDIDGLDPVMLGEHAFYGYEGVLTTTNGIEPFQYWYGDAHGDTYKIEIFGEFDADDVPRDLVDVMLNADFLE